MRKEFVEAVTEEEARDLCPWANRVLAVDGGYQCFESVADYERAIAQV